MDPHDYDCEEEGENAEREFYTVEESTQFSGTVDANGGPVLQGDFAAGGNINVNHVTQQQENTVRTIFNRAVDVFGGAVIYRGVCYTYKAVNGDKREMRHKAQRQNIEITRDSVCAYLRPSHRHGTHNEQG